MKHRVRLAGALFLVCVVAGSVQAQNSALKIQPNGNVGIGTETPAEKLQVEGNLKVNGRIADKTGQVMPVGTILPYAGSVAPAGWLLCNGALYAKGGDQKDLFTIIGTMYGGEGDKFKVPDLRGSFVMGAVPGNNNDSLSKRGVADTHSHTIKLPPKAFTTNQDGKHNHKFPDKWYFRNLASSGLFDTDRHGIDTWGSIKDQRTQDSETHSHKVEVDLPQGTTTVSEGRNRPQWIALNYIIKY